MNTKDILIRWAKTPYPDPTLWFTWEDKYLTADPSQISLEKQLEWPRNTLSVLHSAFEQKLLRNQGWELRDLQGPDVHLHAARFYLRGVPVQSAQKGIASESGTYPVVIQEHTDSSFEDLIDQSFVVCDANVGRLWPFFQRKSHYSFENVCEQKKELSTVAAMLMASKACPTKNHWLIIGGGITCDTAAFAAHLAGASFSLVPTTLLAMVDASIGGKTGVNFHPYGKNLVGAFAFPKRVLIFTHWLETLPIREFYSGGGECFKHALLHGDENLLEILTEIFSTQNFPKLTQYLRILLQVKAEVVGRDPLEQGERAVLNFGHTLAHALEAVSLEKQQSEHTAIRHGEAVSLGLLYVSIVSHLAGLSSQATTQLILETLKKSGCLLSKKELERMLSSPLETLWNEILQKMGHDKKRMKANIDFIYFVLLEKPGCISKPSENIFLTPIPVSIARKAWFELIQALPDAPLSL